MPWTPPRNVPCIAYCRSCSNGRSVQVVLVVQAWSVSSGGTQAFQGTAFLYSSGLTEPVYIGRQNGARLVRFTISGFGVVTLCGRVKGLCQNWDRLARLS